VGGWVGREGGRGAGGCLELHRQHFGGSIRYHQQQRATMAGNCVSDIVHASIAPANVLMQSIAGLLWVVACNVKDLALGGRREEPYFFAL
jgi:hypothetical protein